MLSTDSFSLVNRSSADATNLPRLSNWDVFWLSIVETSDTFSFSESIFLSIEIIPDAERFSADRYFFSSASAFILSFVASCFFLRN